MKKHLYISGMLIIVLMSFQSFAQAPKKTYLVTSGELIFSQSAVSFTDDFLKQYPGAVMSEERTRFTCFVHIGQYVHHDFNNNIGFFTGLGIRNVGMITDETLPQTVTFVPGDTVAYSNYKIVKRQYMLGIPLALKLGSFKNHMYIFGGAEYELAFVYKEKYWTDTWDRSGEKTKHNDWFGDQTPLFFPSVFGGIQFPGGFNVRFKYYLSDFLNTDFKVDKNSQQNSIYSISDLSRYKESQVFYLSLCWQFNSSSLTKVTKSDVKQTSL